MEMHGNKEKWNRMKNEQKKLEIIARNTPPHLSRLEEVGNAITHGLGAVLAIVGMLLLLLKSDGEAKIAAALIYGISMFFMMLTSCLYHSFKSDSKIKRIWRRFDYTSIYFLINGTFAPICLVYDGGTFALSLFTLQWVLALFGICMILIYGPGKWPALHFTLYFVIGWSGLLYIPEFYQHNQPLLWMILLGGIIYTIGMIPFSKKMKGSHFIWHLFVLGGAFIHWLAIYFFIY